MFGVPAFLIPSPDIQPQYLLEATSSGRPFAPPPPPLTGAPQVWSLPLPLGLLPRPFLLPQPGLPPPAALPRHIPLPQTFISRARNFSAGFDLPLRHFLEWPLGVCPHPDGIQMQTGSFPWLWLLSWGKLILTPTSHPPPASLALFLGPEVRAQVNTSACFFPQSQGF